MRDYVYYIDVKKGILTTINKDEIINNESLMLDYVCIFIKNISNGRITLSDSEGISVYIWNNEDVYTYFDRFVEMVDKSQQEELKEWFFNSEWAEYYLERELG